MVMAWSNAQPDRLPCYTFVGPYRQCADARVAKEIALHSGQSHQTISVGREFLDRFSEFAEGSVYVSDGCMDVSGAVELYANKLASEIAPVRLTGNYGSEIVRGYVAFRPTGSINGVFQPDLDQAFQKAGENYAHERRCHPVSFVAFKQVPWFHYSRFSVERSQLSPRSPFLDNDLVKLMYQAPEPLRMSKAPSLRLIAEGNPRLARIPTDRGLVYPEVPVLTRARNIVAEVTARAEYAYDYGMPHWLAKVDSMVAPLHLERLFLGRHKFYHFRTWYRRQLSDYVRDILLSERSLQRPYLNRAQVRDAVERHTKGLGNYTTQIHQLLSLELIHRQLLELN
jgi:asparagine synthase (glutamine-hydrolysing)